MKYILLIFISLLITGCKNDIIVESNNTEVILKKSIDDKITSCKTVTNFALKNNSDEFIDYLSIKPRLKIIFKNGFEKNVELDTIFLNNIKPDSIFNFKIGREFVRYDIFKYEIDNVVLKYEIDASNKINYQFKENYEVDNYFNDFSKIIKFKKTKKYEDFEDVFNNYSLILNEFQNDYNRVCVTQEITGAFENNNINNLNQIFKIRENSFSEPYLINEQEIIEYKKEQENDKKKYGGVITWICAEISNNEYFKNEFIKIHNKYIIDLRSSNTNISDKFYSHFSSFNKKYLKSIDFYIQLLKELNKNYKYNYDEQEFIKLRRLTSKIITERNESAIEYSQSMIQLGRDNNNSYIIKEHEKLINELKLIK